MNAATFLIETNRLFFKLFNTESSTPSICRMISEAIPGNPALPGKLLHGIMAKCRKAFDAADAYQLQEPRSAYRSDFNPENDDIGVKNRYFWDINS